MQDSDLHTTLGSEAVGARELLDPQQAQEYFGGRASVLGVVLQPVALKVLHKVGLAVGGAFLLKGFRPGEAEHSEPSPVGPVIDKGSAHVVACLPEPARASRAAHANRPERPFLQPALNKRVTQQA